MFEVENSVMKSHISVSVIRIKVEVLQGVFRIKALSV